MKYKQIHKEMPIDKSWTIEKDRERFINEIAEIAFGENAIERGYDLDEVIERIQDFSNATNPNFIEDASNEAEKISKLLIKLSDSDLINKRKDLSDSINKIIESNETYVGKVININFPDISEDEYIGVKATGLSKRDVPAKPIKIDDKSLSKETYRYRYNLSGEPMKGSYITDADAVTDGYVSISVLDYSLGSSDFIDDLSKLLNE